HAARLKNQPRAERQTPTSFDTCGIGYLRPQRSSSCGAWVFGGLPCKSPPIQGKSVASNRRRGVSATLLHTGRAVSSRGGQLAALERSLAALVAPDRGRALSAAISGQQVEDGVRRLRGKDAVHRDDLGVTR